VFGKITGSDRPLIPISLGNATFGGFIVGRASRLPTNDLPTQARRPRYIQKSKSKLLFLISPGLLFLKVTTKLEAHRGKKLVLEFRVAA
jgi:hypothetical protein